MGEMLSVAKFTQVPELGGRQICAAAPESPGLFRSRSVLSCHQRRRNEPPAELASDGYRAAALAEVPEIRVLAKALTGKLICERASAVGINRSFKYDGWRIMFPRIPHSIRKRCGSVPATTPTGPRRRFQPRWFLGAAQDRVIVTVDRDRTGFNRVQNAGRDTRGRSHQQIRHPVGGIGNAGRPIEHLIVKLGDECLAGVLAAALLRAAECIRWNPGSRPGAGFR